MTRRGFLVRLCAAVAIAALPKSLVPASPSGGFTKPATKWTWRTTPEMYVIEPRAGYGTPTPYATLAIIGNRGGTFPGGFVFSEPEFA